MANELSHTGSNPVPNVISFCFFYIALHYRDDIPHKQSAVLEYTLF